MSARGALRGLFTSILIVATAPAVAASFGLSPLGLAIGANELSGSVVVSNSGHDEIVIQARPYAWSQSGKESRADTRDLIMNPPIFKLAPGEQQPSIRVTTARLRPISPCPSFLARPSQPPASRTPRARALEAGPH